MLTPGINGPTSPAADQERRRQCQTATGCARSAGPRGDHQAHSIAADPNHSRRYPSTAATSPAARLNTRTCRKASCSGPASSRLISPKHWASLPADATTAPVADNAHPVRGDAPSERTRPSLGMSLARSPERRLRSRLICRMMTARSPPNRWSRHCWPRITSVACLVKYALGSFPERCRCRPSV